MNQSELKKLLNYNPTTGIFTWRVRPKGYKNGKELIAGTISGKYVVISVNRKMCGAHRLAWIYVNGDIPDEMEIDHINRDTRDNRISNLRLASHRQNLMNRGKNKNNTSGYKGVTRNLGRGKHWKASIQIYGKTKSLGCYDTPEDVYKVYIEASSRYYGEFTCIE